MKDITIFFSWQSDLDPKGTRYIIQAAIKAAKKSLKNIVTIESDRDTKGQTGSPNIEEIIFNKIKDCDIFIADVSIVNKYTAILPTSSDDEGITEARAEEQEEASKKHNIRFTPNPNVMEELGYAVAIVGWDNTICVMNTDYGRKEDLPFDLSHHRITDYSMEKSSKAAVITYLRDCIIEHVHKLLEHGIRQKGTNADHVVGYYDVNNRMIVEKMIAISVYDFPYIETFKREKNRLIQNLIEEIKSIHVSRVCSTAKEENEEKALSGSENSTLYPAIQKMIQADYFSALNSHYKPINIDPSDKELITSYVSKVLKQELDEQFFSLGNMHEPPFHIPGFTSSYEATPEEEKKYIALKHLVKEIMADLTFDAYLETFENVKLYPLAICNKSKNADQHLTVTLIVENGEVIVPSKDFISESVKHCEGLIHDLGFIKSIFELPETGDISDNTEHEYIAPRMKGYEGDPLGGYHLADSDEDDYEDDLKQYFLSPIKGSNEYKVNISLLRPDEKSWLGIVALKDDGAIPAIRYRVWSENTDGSIEGIIQ